MRKADCIAVFGTGSDVGKSIVASALCRIFNDTGLSVAPFKSQNMSNNSFVTADGGEMGRAQVVQAECARVEPTVDMNPLLLKPSGNSKSQVVLRGVAKGEMSSLAFRDGRAELFDTTMESLDRLRDEYELVVIEGAGSCAEVNLRDYDIANFRTALACGAPVIIVADIDRGGVFAQVIGTLELLDNEERALVKGIIINRFRGDPTLFDDGIKFIEERTGVDVLGLVPYFDNIDIDSEDSLHLEKLLDPPVICIDGKINVAVIRLPRISNFTDFAPLERETEINISYLSRAVPLKGIDLVIIPGSKNVRSDLAWLKDTGWADEIKSYVDHGGSLCGICGGYQMLGNLVDDPSGVEGEAGSSEGLSLLDISTVLERQKRLGRVRAKFVADGDSTATGYEIHMGKTVLGEGLKPLFNLSENGESTGSDGAVNENGKVFGTYLHGLFDEWSACEYLLGKFGRLTSESGSHMEYKEKQYDLLADHFRKHLDMERLFNIAGVKPEKVKVEG